MDPKGVNSTEPRLAQLAANQHGVVTLTQLRTIGISSDAAKQRARRGRLHRVHRGVYAVGHPGLSHEGRWMAAVLALGPDTVLSHRAAAALWGMLRWPGGHVDVTVPPGGRRRREGIRVHRSRLLLPGRGSPAGPAGRGSPSQTTCRRNIPVTTPSRTLQDLRGLLSDQEFNMALRQAEVRGYPVDQVEIAGRQPTHTELERRFLRLCRRHRLPEPEVNAPVGRYLADFLWRDASLIVETDSWRFHRGRANFEHDHRRQTVLAAAGYEVLRFTWRQVADQPGEVAAAVRARVSARRGSTAA